MNNALIMFCAAGLLAAAGAAQAHVVVYTTSLSGPNEAPPNNSPGTGTSTVTVDLDLLTMRVEVQFQGLLGNVTACHIHGPTLVALQGTAGVMTPVPSFPGFPHGGTSGVYDQTFDLTQASTYNPAFVTASGGTIAQAMNRLLLALDEDKSYVNIHTNQFPGGEIRGFLIPTPGAMAMFALCGLAAARRRR